MLENNRRNRNFLSHMGSRGAFGKAVSDLLVEGNDLYAVSADFAIPSGFSKAMEKFPDRIYDIGIAEQNMLAIAAGLAEEDVPVFATSWGCFSSYRCADQVRVFMGLMGSNIKLTGLTSGLSGFQLGGSHYCVGDIALLRGIPGLVILSPCDGMEIYECVKAAADYKGPVYIRLTGGNNLPILNNNDNYSFKIGEWTELRGGEDTVVIGTGTILKQCMHAAVMLEENGISCCVINMSTIKPLNTKLLKKIQEYKTCFVVEEHNILGGVGAAIAEECSFYNTTKIVRIGIPDFMPVTGEYEYLLEQTGLLGEQIANKIKECIGVTERKSL